MLVADTVWFLQVMHITPDTYRELSGSALVQPDTLKRVRDVIGFIVITRRDAPTIH